MTSLKTIASGIAIAGSLGFAALGLGSGVASAAPSYQAPETTWAQDPGWGHGHGPGWHGDGDGWRGPGWAPPPPPYYGGYGPPCVTGPLGFLHFCA